MSDFTRTRSHILRGFALVSGAMLAGVGCAQHQTSLAEGRLVTTASVEAVRAADIPLSAPRTITQTRFSVSAKSGSVAHTPVYFRSDTERSGDGNTDFGISGKDLTLWIPEAARFFISIALHPIDLLVTPPWTDTESDGQQVGRAASDPRSEHGSG